MLYPIHTMGIRAWCSDMVIESEHLRAIYFMSICGHQVTVRGLIANLLEGAGVTLEVDGDEYFLERSGSYKIRTKKLPSGLVHSVMISDLAIAGSNIYRNGGKKNNDGDDSDNDRFLIITNEQDLQKQFFHRLDERTEIPLHPSWAPWLWMAFKRQEEWDWLIELHTLVGSFKGCEVDFHQSRLHDLISEAIKRRVPEIMGCFSREGVTEKMLADIETYGKRRIRM